MTRDFPCFLFHVLAIYGERLPLAFCSVSPMMRCSNIVSGITSIHFSDDDPAWSQTSLPIGVGGHGSRHSVQLVPSAFMASAAVTCELV